MKAGFSRVIYIFLFCCIFGLTALADTGRVCVLDTIKEPLSDEGGAFQPQSGGTPDAVQIQIDRGRRIPVSPSERGNFKSLSLKTSHIVSIFSYDGKNKIVSFKFRFPVRVQSMCMKRKLTYGTWSIEEESNTCRCP